MNTKVLASMLFSILIFGFFATSVMAVAIGVNRADISIPNVLRNGYAEETFVVSTDSPELIGGIVEVEGDIADWVSFRPETATEGFEFSASIQFPITIIIQPPDDAANGNYEGTIRVLTGEVSRGGDGQYGTSLRAAFKIAGVVGITGVETRRCTLGGVQVISTEVNQPLDVMYTIKNTGNVRIQPQLNIVIYDQLQENIVSEGELSTPNSVLPTTQENLLSQYDQELPAGQYWVSVTSDDCVGGSTITFDVLERGGVLDQGEFLKIEAEPWNLVGDIIPITAVFRNTGERTVSAKFKGTIMSGSKLFKVIDTDLYNTPPSDTARIETFFNPSEPGQYEVKGRVLYNNKLTFERTAIVNVRGDALTKSFPSWIFLVVIIIFLFFIIRKKKKRKY